MAIIFILVKNNFIRLMRNRAALLLLIVTPFVLIWLFGAVFGVNRTDSGPVGVRLAVVSENDSPAASQLLTALQAESAFNIITTRDLPDHSSAPLTRADLRPLMQADEFRFALIIPADAIQANPVQLHLIFLSNPRNAIESATVGGILREVIFSKAPDLLAPLLPREAAAFDMSHGVKLDSELVVAENVKSPQATLIVGGWAMQFLLFALSSSAAVIYQEKESGIYQRLLSTTVTRAHLIWSKFVYGVLVGVIQLLVLFFAGRLLYGIDVEHHLALLLLVCALAAASCTAFGLLIAAFSPGAEASRGMSTLLILLMSALGGAWFPVSFMPQFIQHLSKFTLVYWSMLGFQQVLWSNDTFVQLLPTLGILSAITAAVMVLVIWRLNRSHVFE